MKHWRILSIALISGSFTLSHQANSSQGYHQWDEQFDSAVMDLQNKKDSLTNGTIALEAFQIVDGDSDEVLLKMDKDGKCYLNAGFVGTITAAGEVISDEGELVARLKGDKFMTTDNKALVTIKSDGKISGGTVKDLGWGPDGFLTHQEIGLKLVPANTKAKVAASMLLTAFMGFGISK